MLALRLKTPVYGVGSGKRFETYHSSAREAPAATNEKAARCSIGGRARGGTCNYLCNDEVRL